MTSIRLDDKQIRKNILAMIVPMTIESLLQMTAGIVSMAMIGRLDALAVGAIGMSNTLIRILWAMFRGISTGASVFVAQSHGANDSERFKRVTEHALILTVGAAFILQILLYIFAEPLISLFNPTEALLADGVMYTRTLSFSLPATALIVVVAGILQGLGNARTPMIVIGILNLVNIVSSYALIFGNFGLPALGLRGAAMGYVIAYIVAALMCVYILVSKEGLFSRFDGKFEFKIGKFGTMELIKFGMPVALEISFFQVAAIPITRAIMIYGDAAYAAYQFGVQAESLSFMPAAGFSVAAATFIGQAIGSKDISLGKRYYKELRKLIIIITVFTGGALLFFPRQMMGLFTDNAEVISIGVGYVFLMGFVQIPQNITSLHYGALRGAGYPKLPMYNALIGFLAIRIPFIYISTFLFKADIMWIWIIISLDMLFRFVNAARVFKKRNIFEEENVKAKPKNKICDNRS